MCHWLGSGASERTNERTTTDKTQTTNSSLVRPLLVFLVLLFASSFIRRCLSLLRQFAAYKSAQCISNASNNKCKQPVNRKYCWLCALLPDINSSTTTSAREQHLSSACLCVVSNMGTTMSPKYICKCCWGQLNGGRFSAHFNLSCPLWAGKIQFQTEIC